MQRLFIIKESGGEISQVENFIGKTGKIVSVTAQHVSTAVSSRAAGRWLVVADDGKGENLEI